MQDHARQFSDVLRREQEAMQQVFFFSSFSFFFYSSFRDLHRRAPPVRTGGHAAGFFIIYIYMYTHTHIHRYIYINICYIYKQIKVPGFVDVAPGTSDADTLHMQAILFIFFFRSSWHLTSDINTLNMQAISRGEKSYVCMYLHTHEIK